MKNIRLLVSGLCMFLAAGLGCNQAVADAVDAPGKVKLKIETKNINKQDAATILSGDGKISLGVYLCFDAAWETRLNANQVQVSSSRMSYAFFNTKDYTPGDYFNNFTADYITICASDNEGKITPPSWGCNQVQSADPMNWYTGVTWYTFGSWPIWSYGGGFLSGMPIYPTMSYFKTADGYFEIKLFDLQFVLKQSTRDIPVGFIDDLDVIDGSSGNVEMNIVTPGLNDYRPHGITATDWTDPRMGSYFEFINGGIFFETGPVVERFEPKFLS